MNSERTYSPRKQLVLLYVCKCFFYSKRAGVGEQCSGKWISLAYPCDIACRLSKPSDCQQIGFFIEFKFKILNFKFLYFIYARLKSLKQQHQISVEIDLVNFKARIFLNAALLKNQKIAFRRCSCSMRIQASKL